MLKEEIKSLKAEVVEKKRMLATVVKDPKKITAKVLGCQTHMLEHS